MWTTTAIGITETRGFSWFNLLPWPWVHRSPCAAPRNTGWKATALKIHHALCRVRRKIPTWCQSELGKIWDLWRNSRYPLVMTHINIEHSYLEWVFPFRKKVIFHSYVRLPEGKNGAICCYKGLRTNTSIWSDDVTSNDESPIRSVPKSGHLWTRRCSLCVCASWLAKLVYYSNNYGLCYI